MAGQSDISCVEESGMANKRGNRGSGFFWGLILGMATGFVLALLFAPQPGDVTREQLAEQSMQMRKRGQERAEQFTAQFRERYGEAMEQGREAYVRAKDEILSQRNQVHNAQ
jgi:gas vesicle protein